MTEQEISTNERIALELAAMRENLIRVQKTLDRRYKDTERIQNAISRTRAKGVLLSGVLKTVPWRFDTESSVAYYIVCTEPEKLVRALPAVFDAGFLPWIDLSDDATVRLCVQDEYTGPRSKEHPWRTRVVLTIDLGMSPEEIDAWIEKLGIEIDVEVIAGAISESEQEIARLSAIARRFQRGSP